MLIFKWGERLIKSMTGYGRYEYKTEQVSIGVELRSVNHRYTDFKIRTPRMFSYVEEPIRCAAQDKIKRGKVDINVEIETFDKEPVLSVNSELAKSYVDALHDLADKFSLDDSIDVCRLARFPDVFSVESNTVDEEQMVKDVCDVFSKAYEDFLSMRKAEGEKLCADLCARLDLLSGYVDKVRERAPEIIAAYTERLRARMEEMLKDVPVDEGRLLNEVAVFTDRVNVDEEMVRLKSHIEQFKTILKSDEPVGRKLDFLVQEINREINTIGSKSNDLETTRYVVEMKTETEKIREQVQNIE